MTALTVKVFWQAKQIETYNSIKINNKNKLKKK